MREDMTTIELPIDRPNFTYGVLPMEGKKSNLKNLDFLVPPYGLDHLPFNKFIVWIENRDGTDRIARYLNDRLLESERRTEPFHHIHSNMSLDYIQNVLGEFCKPGGRIRGLIATGAVSNVRTQ